MSASAGPGRIVTIADTRAAAWEVAAREAAELAAAGAAGDADATWLVTNCRVLSEGVDLPAVDLAMIRCGGLRM